MKKILQKLLKISAKLILKKYNPKIIGITGSAGKTEAREAVYAALSAKFKARESEKNYNNEIGVPLAIIGSASPGKSISAWLKVFVLACGLLFKKNENYPEILILEMAADKPGDMDYLTDIVKPNIGVITSIGYSHIENFGSIEKIRREKFALIQAVKPGGSAILNIDDKRVKSFARETKLKVLTYGIESGEAEVSGKELRFINDENRFGMNFKLIWRNAFAPVFLPDVISKSGVYAALAGACAGIINGMNLVEIARALERYSHPNGRMKLLKGVKHTCIIDDTYNASPASCALAVETLVCMPKEKFATKYAVLGDMLELGIFSEKKHEETGRMVAKNKIGKLIVVGERSRDIARGALKSGMKQDDIFHFADTESAGKFIQERIMSGDIILIKGSQGARMEKITKELMAEPLRAEELLVRQGREWKNK